MQLQQQEATSKDDDAGYQRRIALYALNIKWQKAIS